MKVTLRVDSLSVVNWWVYVSYITYDDFMGNTGCMISLVQGEVLISSLKQNQNLKSSTEG